MCFEGGVEELSEEPSRDNLFQGADVSLCFSFSDLD